MATGVHIITSDLMHLYPEHTPRHSKIYTDFIPIIEDVFTRYRDEVREKVYPGPEHSVLMEEAELEKFARAMQWDAKLEEIENRRREASKPAAPSPKKDMSGSTPKVPDSKPVVSDSTPKVPDPKPAEPAPKAPGRHKEGREIPADVAQLGKASDKVRALAMAGWSVGDIYPALGITYQHAYSIFHRPMKGYEPPKKKTPR